MLTSGLVGVTFRSFSSEKIARVMKQAGLTLIEWGGDVQIPPSNEAGALETLELTKKYGIVTASYGSYYRADGNGEAMAANLRCAERMQAPNIRIWAGRRGSADADAGYRASVVADIQAMCDACAGAGMTVSTEFHGGTLTDEYPSAVALAQEVDRENFRLYWQPNQFRDEAYNLAAVRAVLPYLSHVHVFTWRGHGRYPLAEGTESWKRYIDVIASDGLDHGMLMEFVPNETEEELYRDAEVLHSWGVN